VLDPRIGRRCGWPSVQSSCHQGRTSFRVPRCFHENVFDIYQVGLYVYVYIARISSPLSNFDNALRRTKQWADKNIAAAVIGSGNATAVIHGSNAANETASAINLTPSQRKRIKQYLKRCRANPRHSQMNMESYLLLPVQRIPRYRLLVRPSFFVI
jgi:hypothetical protein